MYAVKLTGAFRVPVSENGVIPYALNIMLTNRSQEDHTFKVKVLRTPNTFYPDTSKELLLLEETVTLPAHSNTKVIARGFSTEDFLNVALFGNSYVLRDDILVYSFLANFSGQNIPSTVFSNKEYTLVKLC